MDELYNPGWFSKEVSDTGRLQLFPYIVIQVAGDHKDRGCNLLTIEEPGGFDPVHSGYPQIQGDPVESS